MHGILGMAACTPTCGRELELASEQRSLALKLVNTILDCLGSPLKHMRVFTTARSELVRACKQWQRQ